MGGLAGTAAKLLASLELDTRPFEAGARRAGAAIGTMERRFGKIGSIAQRGIQNAVTNISRLGIVAGGVLIANITRGVDSLAELERVTNATAGVIESTGGKAGVSAVQVRELAQSLEAVTTADDKVIQSGQNLLLTFTNIGSDVFPQATKAMVDMGIAMAQGDVANADFKSSAIQIGKALQDPIKGITALRRVGVNFTEAQKDQIKRLVESGRTMEAQQLILRELEVEFGKAGEAAGKGFGADMRRFQDAVEDAQQALARGFLPIISRVSQFLQRKLADEATIAQIEEFGQNLADGFEEVLEIGKRIPWAQIGDSMKIAGAGAKALFDAFTSLPPWVQTAVLTGWGLNKLTGGALGGIVGELGKGLIKGVLGMNAGVVNINAGVVNGGGAPGAAARGAGAGSAILGGASVASLGAALGIAMVPVFAAGLVIALRGSEQIAADDLRARQETAAARGLDPARVPTVRGHLGFNPAAAARDAAMAADHSRDASEAARDTALMFSKRSLRIYGETETKRGEIDWAEISRNTSDTKEKLESVIRTGEETRGAVKWGAQQTTTAANRTTAAVNTLDDRPMRATVPVSVYVNGVPVKTYQGATWVGRATSGGNIRGGAD